MSRNGLFLKLNPTWAISAKSMSLIGQGPPEAPKGSRAVRCIRGRRSRFPTKEGQPTDHESAFSKREAPGLP